MQRSRFVEFGTEGVMRRVDAAKFLGVCVRTIDRMIEDGSLSARKDGRNVRVCRKSIRLYLENLPELHEARASA